MNPMNPHRPSRFLTPALLAALASIQSLHAAPQTWDGDTSGAWATGTNWAGDPADVNVPGAGDIATFNAASGNTTSISAAQSALINSCSITQALLPTPSVSPGWTP